MKRFLLALFALACASVLVLPSPAGPSGEQAAVRAAIENYMPAMPRV